MSRWERGDASRTTRVRWQTARRRRQCDGCWPSFRTIEVGERYMAAVSMPTSDVFPGKWVHQTWCADHTVVPLAHEMVR